MARMIDAGFRAIEALLVLLLAIMVAMVFGNVVLRYGFSSGITISEEVSRLLFLWVTFLGSVPVLRANGHLGVDMVVDKLPRAGRTGAKVVSHLLVLGCAALFAWGAWQQVLLNRANAMPVSGIPTGWAYGAAVVSAVGMGLLIAADIVRILLGRPERTAAPKGGDV